MKLLMILTVLGSLVALWFSLMLLGFVAARLLRIAFRAGLTLLAGGLLLTAAVARRSLSLARCVASLPLAWAECRWYTAPQPAFGATKISHGAIPTWECSDRRTATATPTVAVPPAERTLMFRGESFRAVRAQPVAGTARPESWHHSECGHTNRPESKYCGKCGLPRLLAHRRGEVWTVATPVATASAAPTASSTADAREVTWLGQRPNAGIVFLDEARPQREPILT